MLRSLYRLRYLDGGFSAWSTDKESIMLKAKLFNAFVETWIRG